MGDCEQKDVKSEWENVLIEWVNCLSLSQTISSVSDLKDGEYFIVLLQLLTKSTLSHDTWLSKLKEVEEKNYPNLYLARSKLNINKLNHNDLILLSMLLLHYTCVIDRRETLTAPLCHKLTEKAQLHAKYFLETFTVQSNASELERMLQNPILKKTPSRTPKSLYTGGDSVYNFTSPLQDFLQAPTPKSGRLHERDRELKKIKHELQMEKFEKEDMSVELKEHKEKIKKLNQQVNEKTVMISQLRGELVALENRTPPHKPRGVQEIERLLRAELSDSQYYISQLQAEQDKLQNENDEAIKKLKKSEEDICFLQARGDTFETKFEQIQEKYKEQIIELSSLRLNYSEVQALLEEMRTSKNESGVELDMSENKAIQGESSGIFEDLGCTVVDVQLREVQHENSLITKSLKDMEAKSIELEDNLSNVREDFKALANKYDIVQNENRHLNMKIQELSNTQSQLEDNNKSLLDDMQALTDKNVIQQEEFMILQNTLFDANTTLSNRDKLITSLQKDITQLQIEHKDWQKQLRIRDKQYQELEKESHSLQLKCEDSVKAFTSKQFDYDSLVTRYNDLDARMEENLQHLEKCFGDEDFSLVENREHNFVLLVNRLEQRGTNYKLESERRQDEINSNLIMMCSLERDLQELMSKDALNLRSLQTITCDLDAAKEQIQNLEVDLDMKNKKVEELNSKIDEMNVSISDYEELKELIEFKTKCIASLEQKNSSIFEENAVNKAELLCRIKEQERMSGVLDELEKVRMNLLEEFVVKDKQIEEYKKNEILKDEEITGLQTQFKECENKLIENRKLYEQKYKEDLETINSLNSKVHSYEEQIETLTVELKLTQDIYNIKLMELDDITKLKAQIEIESGKQKDELSKKIDLLERTVENLQQELKKVLRDKFDLDSAMDQQKCIYAQLKEEKQQSLAQCEMMRNEISTLSRLMMEKENTCADHDEVISRSTQELVSLKLQVQEKCADMNGLKEKIECLHEEKIISQNMISELKNTNMSLHDKISDLNEEITLVTKLRDDLCSKHEQLEKNVHSIFNQLNIKSDDLNDGVHELAMVKNAYEQQINHVKSQLEEATNRLDKANEDRVTIVQSHESTLKEMNEAMIQMNGDLDNLRTQEIGSLQEIGMLKDELSYTINKYTDALQAEKDLKAENELQITHLTENIHNMVTKYNQLDNKHVEVLTELKHAKQLIEEHVLLQERLEIQLVQQKKTCQEEFSAITDQYKVELESLTTSQTKLAQDMQFLQKDLDETRGSKLHIQSELKRIENEHQTVIHEKSDLVKKIKSITETTKQYETEIHGLNIKHENYLEKNACELAKLRTQLEEKVKELDQHKVLTEFEGVNLRSKIRELENNAIVKHKEFISSLETKDANIAMLQSRIDEFETNLRILKDEQAKMLENIQTEKNRYENLNKDNDEQVNELQRKISQQSCAYNVLETGKQKLEEIIEELQGKYDALLMEKDQQYDQYHAEKISTNMKLEDYKTQVDEKDQELKLNLCKQQELVTEVQVLKKFIETMKADSESVISHRIHLEKQLDVIEEDSNRKIRQSLEALKHVKCKYNQIKGEIVELQNHYESLKEELVTCSQLRNEAEINIKHKEHEMRKLQFRHDGVLELKTQQHGTIISLQEEIEAKLEQLEQSTWEKIQVETKLQATKEEYDAVIKVKDDLLHNHKKLIEETEKNLLRAHDDAVAGKNELVERINKSENETKDMIKIKEDVENLLLQERKSKEFLEMQVLELTSEKYSCQQVSKKLKEGISRICSVIQDKQMELDDVEVIDEMIEHTEGQIVKTFAKLRALNDIITDLEKNKSETAVRLKELEKCNVLLNEDKDKLIDDYKKLQIEKELLGQDKDKDTKCLDNLKIQYDVLKERYEEFMEQKDSKQSLEFQMKLDELKLQNAAYYNEYQEFLSESKVLKIELDKIKSERSSLENIVLEIKDKHVTIQMLSAYLTEENHRLHYEQKQAIEVIVDDIQKQFNRLSKISFNVCISTLNVFEKTVTGILTDKPVQWRLLLKDLNTEDVVNKWDDLKYNTSNTLEQMRTFEKALKVLETKGDLKPRILKENVQHASNTQKPKEEDWKKKYTTIKQKLTLVENAKNNYEKKIKQLREENKSLSKTNINEAAGDSDEHYKQLLQEHLSTKQELEKQIAVYDEKYKIASKDLERQKVINNLKKEHDSDIKVELEKMRDIFSDAKLDISRLETERSSLRQLLDDKNEQLSSLNSIKESYEKLFEENNKLMSEIDTLKYKRNRDREEYVRLIKKEKEDGDFKKVQEVRVEYEVKLEKMKQKMIQLYKEEVDKQIEKVVAEKDHNVYLANTVEKLRDDLTKAKMVIVNLESEKSVSQMHYPNNYDMVDAQSRESLDMRDSNSLMLARRASSHNLGSFEVHRSIDDRRYSTLPKSMSGMDVIEEVRISRRTSINPAQAQAASIEMEDEAEMFNNKYLTELKEGPGFRMDGRESTSSRMSELAYRNSLCPPHLKSSYPAETQFLNPRRFRDDDLKSGNVDFDDSMSTRLLPNDKPKKKDIGTTSYKKPGPPTPSKNGGRASLQGNEIHPREVLREMNDQRAGRKTTPNRLKALFSRSKDTSENGVVSPPKGKRLSIFRKPR